MERERGAREVDGEGQREIAGNRETETGERAADGERQREIEGDRETKIGGESSRSWFTVAVSAADSAGTETDRSRRLGSVSGDTRKTLQRQSLIHI